jgi:hypothetical protein
LNALYSECCCETAPAARGVLAQPKR